MVSPSKETEELTTISGTEIAQECPNLVQYPDLTFGQSLSALQVTRQQYASCAASKKQLIEALKVKEDALAKLHQQK